MATHPPTIKAVLAGKPIAEERVRAWEAARMRKAAKKIGLPTPTGNLANMRTAFTNAKLSLHPNDVRGRLDRDLRRSTAVARMGTRVSQRHRATSTCDLYVAGGTAAEFVDWFTDTNRRDYTRSMIAANPDHFLIDTTPDGRQEVIETTGGSPLATRFLIDYTDTANLTTPRDPDFPLDTSGTARTETGVAIGGVRHEFRDQTKGFHAHLCVEFPRLTMPTMIAQHRIHLACEFSNWITLAFAD